MKKENYKKPECFVLGYNACLPILTGSNATESFTEEGEIGWSFAE